MPTPKIFESEYRFCLILWEHEPIKSMELAKLCKEKLDWSKTTTYTVIKRLCERGVIRNENAIVTSIISKEQHLMLRNISIDSYDGLFSGTLTVMVDDTSKLELLIKKLRTVKGVKQVSRC